MGEVEDHAEGNCPKAKDCPVGPEIYIAFPVAKSKGRRLHMELRDYAQGRSYELFWECLNMQKGAGCNSLTF